MGEFSHREDLALVMYYYNNAYTDEIFSTTGLCLDRMQMASQTYRTVGEKVVVIKDQLNDYDRGEFLSDADCEKFVFDFVMKAEHVGVKILGDIQANTFRV